MDKENVSFFLKKANPIVGGMEDLLNSIDDTSKRVTDGGSFFPEVMLIFPQLYRARNRSCVNICGEVDHQSEEYKTGFRFFDNNGEFYDDKGKSQYSNSDYYPLDLIECIPPQADTSDCELVSPYTWVHPAHMLSRTWFTPISTITNLGDYNNRFVNRMGLVIELFNTDEPDVYRDNNDRIYGKEGQFTAKTFSMFDLVYNIRHWKIFVEYDWSKAYIPNSQNSESFSPETFDPTVANHNELRRQFFGSLATTSELAEQLGIKLNFKMDND